MQNTDRIRTTHVGSLVRPPEFVALLRRQSGGEPVDEAEFADALNRAVVDVVRRQAETGLDFISDGEFGKSISWSRYVLERMNGFVQEETEDAPNMMPAAVFGKDREEFAEFYAEYDQTQNFVGMRGWVVTGPVTYGGHDEIRRDIDNFRQGMAGLDGVAGFMPAVAPSSVAPDRDDRYYDRPEDCLAAIADALHDEYREIIDGGFLLQVDDAYFASLYDMMPGLSEYRDWAAGAVEVINHALRDIPPEKTRFHVCWGSWNGPHVSDVELKDMVDLMLRVRVGGYAIEMANPRHEHEWAVWRDVELPDGRVLIPGVISHATNVVEHPDLVTERIVRLADLVGRENVIAGTDCGFAQGPFTNRVHPSIQWAKLRSLVEGADRATKILWG